jgi:uncharacterized protein YgfB (UPF0149 family)
MDIELLEKAIAASRTLEPAEIHGSCCGMAAGQPQEFVLANFIELHGTDALEDEVTVREFVTATLDQLHAQDLEFHPVMPDDEAPLTERLLGLSSWCAAFLVGFGAVVPDNMKTWPDEVAEIIRDYASISGLNDEEAETEQNESSFMELYEYVRVGAVLIVALMTEHQEQQEREESSED